MSTELVPTEVTKYAAMMMPVADLGEMIADNLGNQSITEFDLTRIKIPTGGGMAFTIPTVEGLKVTEKVSGVILFHRQGRAYWESNFDQSGGGTPPDCVSDDAVTGSTYGDCGTCEYAKYGTKLGNDGKPGKGQACRNFALVFLLDPAKLLPSVVVLPPTSLKILKAYMVGLVNEIGRPYWGVVTEFGLEQSKNGAGIAYSRIKCRMVKALTGEEAAIVRERKAVYEPLFKRVTIEQADVEQSEQ